MNKSTRFLHTLSTILTRAGRLRTVFGLMLLALGLSTSMAHAQVYDLHRFSNPNSTFDNPDGLYPTSDLINVNGTLYGTTSAGGANGDGTIFTIKPDGTGFQTLHTFGSTANDGAAPQAGFLNVNGTLYGTTASGGADNEGTVFTIKTDGTGYQVLYSFQGYTALDGATPEADLISVNGILYGTTYYGGNTSHSDGVGHGYGTVFSFDPAKRVEKVLTNFTGGINGANPAAVLLNVNGTLYGTTVLGGSINSGTVFAINLDGSGFQTLYSFVGTSSNHDGQHPRAGLIDLSGILYGTTNNGGSKGYGTIYSINPNGTNYQQIHDFNAKFVQTGPNTYAYTDGRYPSGSLIDINGILYGTTEEGGFADDSAGYGTIFSFDPASNAEEIVSSFNTEIHGSGGGPTASLLNINGTLYGTASGDVYGYGTVFRLPITPGVPVAHDDAYTGQYKATITGNTLTNDDPNGSVPLTATLVTSTSHGTLSLSSNGAFTYTPNDDFSGTDLFTYQAVNPMGQSNTATVTLTVVASLPVAHNDACSINYNTARINPAPGVLDNDSAGAPGSLQAILITNVTHGTLTLNSNGGFTYTPNTGYIGTDSFTYQAVNTVGKSNTATVTLTVLATPLARNDGCTIIYNTTRSNPAPGVLGNDYSPPSGGAMTALLADSTLHGSVTLNSDGSFVYTPNTGYAGTDTFTYQAVNSVGKSNIATCTLTVVASTPTAHNDACTIVYNKARTNAAPGVLANDDNGGEGPLTATLVSNVTHGSLTLGSDGSFVYTPNTGYVGTDSFTYQVSNPVGKGTIGTVTLTVVPTTPTARNDGATILHNTGRFFSAPGVLSNDDDGGAGSMTSTLIQTTQHGTVSLGSNGSFSYTPFTGYSGTDTFTYQVANSVGTGNIATVTLTVQ